MALSGAHCWRRRFPWNFARQCVRRVLWLLECRSRWAGSPRRSSQTIRAWLQYGEVKMPWGGPVGEQAKAELFSIRHLGVGKQSADIDGKDQDGKPFKLSDYRGKVVLLYFWSEY